MTVLLRGYGMSVSLVNDLLLRATTIKMQASAQSLVVCDKCHGYLTLGEALKVATTVFEE